MSIFDMFADVDLGLIDIGKSTENVSSGLSRSELGGRKGNDQPEAGTDLPSDPLRGRCARSDTAVADVLAGR